MDRLLPLIALLALAAPAAADVTSATDTSFEVTETASVAGPIDRVWAELKKPQDWWDKAHTYSGDSANLYLDAQATGCFCEKLKDKGSVEHARIVYIAPPNTLRLRGALGPLQGEAVVATWTISLAPDGDAATKVTMDYVVGGFMRQGGEKLAPAVDAVLGHQLELLKAAAEAAAAAPAEDRKPAN